MCQVPFCFYFHLIDEKLRPEENKSVSKATSLLSVRARIRRRAFPLQCALQFPQLELGWGGTGVVYRSELLRGCRELLTKREITFSYGKKWSIHGRTPPPPHPGTCLVPGLPRVSAALSGAVVCTQSAPGLERRGGSDDIRDLDTHCLLSPSPLCYLIRCPPGFMGLWHQLVTSVTFHFRGGLSCQCLADSQIYCAFEPGVRFCSQPPEGEEGEKMPVSLIVLWPAFHHIVLNFTIQAICRILQQDRLIELVCVLVCESLCVYEHIYDSAH